MVRFFLALLLITLCSPTSGQNITVDQAISLRIKSLASVEEFLTAKKWEMIEATQETDDKMGFVNFAYNKSSYDDKAESFIIFYYDNSSTINNRLSIQVNKVSTYNVYIARLKALGYKLEKSYIEDGSMIKIYKGNGNTIRVRTSTQEEYTSTRTSYSFFICNSLDFTLQFDK
jgi:hypothetical protein